MIKHVKRLAKKKSVMAAVSAVAVTGTIALTQFSKTPEPTKYVLAAASRGTLITSITGSGQVSGQDQFDVKPKVSGSITNILVQPGDTVTEGTALLEIDRTQAVKTVRDAQQSVHDAELSLQSAELSFKKSQQPADSVQLLQAQDTIEQAKRNLDDILAGPDQTDIDQAETELELQRQNVRLADDGRPQVVRDAYDETVPTLKTISQTLEQALYNADAVLGIDNVNLNDSFESVLSVLDSGKLAEATQNYQAAKPVVMQLKSETEALASSNEAPATIDADLEEARTAIDVSTKLLENVRDVLTNTIASASFSQSSLDSLRSSSRSDLTNVSSKLSTLNAAIKSIDQAKTTYEGAKLNVTKAEAALEKIKQGADPSDIASARERLAEAEASLEKLKSGPDPIDVAISQNSLAQRRSSLQSAQNRLADAQETLNDYTVRAPFDGVIARLLVRPYDDASPSAGIVTLITDAKIAEISLNEVDVAKVKTGQKTSLTFDAIPDLTIAGIVAEVDPIGTASQGVVNYSVKIAFQTQDDRIKAGMNVSASIVTDMQSDVLLVPNAAVQTLGGNVVVQTLPDASGNDALAPEGVTSDTGPQSKPVIAGMSNDSETEIVSGLNDGDFVIIRTIEPATKTTTASNASTAGSVRLPGVSTFGGGTAGGVRFSR